MASGTDGETILNTPRLGENIKCITNKRYVENVSGTDIMIVITTLLILISINTVLYVVPI